MKQRGFGMIEVLVTLIIISVGLLGLAGLQARAQRVELESYQRAQALVMIEDMANRIRANRPAARCYETDSFIGTGTDDGPAEPAACTGWGTNATRALAFYDLVVWDNLLEGRGESLNGNNVGAMTGARGCVTYDSTDEVYTIAVAWQGEIETVEPTSTCAEDEYGDDALRRVVTRDLTFPDLSP